MNNVKRFNIIAPLIAGLALAGCATGSGNKTVEPAAAAKDARTSPVYLEGMTALSQSKASSEACLKNAADFKGKNWKVLIKHANGCAKAGDWKNLDLTAQEIARVEINSPWGAYFHSLASENTGDLPRALWMIELAMKKTPGAPLFHYQKGRVMWRLKNFKGGVDEISTAVKRDPSLIDGHVFLAEIFHRDQIFDKAASHYEAALALDARQRTCLEGLADIRMSQNKYDKAVELLTSAVSGAGDDFRLRVKLAMAHEAIDGNQEKALATYRTARDLMGRSKGATADVDVNEKIKTLEAKIAESKTPKQANLEAPVKGRAPAKTPANKGGKK